MSEALFIVCIAVICALALVLIVWLIVSLVQMNKNKKASGKVVVVDEKAYELVPLGEAPSGATYIPAPAVSDTPPAPVSEELASGYAYAAEPEEDAEGTVTLRRNEAVPYPEAYKRLSSKQKGYVDEILRYAESKEGVKKIVNDKSASVYLGKKLVVRIILRRGIVSARLTVQNNDFIAYTDNAGLNIKEKPIDVKVEQPEMVSAVKDIIDITFRDLTIERARKDEEKRAARREKRRLAREAKLAAEREAAAAAEETAADEPAAEEAAAEEPAEAVTETEAPAEEISESADAADETAVEGPAAEEAAAEEPAEGQAGEKSESED